MPVTKVNCPNCRQQISAEIEQLFDVGDDPTAKQRLLSGAFNMIQCPFCGYQGSLATPIVYHDPEKELLLTFIPPEIGLSRDEQERVLGNLINQVMNRLPQEKRKAYLLQPQATLTMQGLVERVLEADGITREMIQEQQQRLNLIQRLVNTPDESALETLAKEEDGLIDAEFFTLLTSLTRAAMAGGDQDGAQRLSNLQQRLLPITSFGREMQAQSKEIEKAITDLRELGEDLNREKMVDLVLTAENDTRIRALVSLARPVMDYQFFQLLSDRIDRARGEGRSRLVDLRTTLLELTQEIDQQITQHIEQTKQLIDAILQTDNIKEATMQSLPAVDEYFLQEVNRQLEEARKQGDLEKSSKLGEIIEVIQEAAASPPELALIEEYFEAPDDQARQQFLEAHQEEITNEFMDMLANIALQAQSSDDKNFAEQVMSANRYALRFSMQKNLRGA